MKEEYNHARVTSLVGNKRMNQIMRAQAQSAAHAPKPKQEDAQTNPKGIMQQYHSSRGTMGIINEALGGRFGPQS